MSGGVDSTACALMLKETHEVEGFFMNLNQPNFTAQQEKVSTIADTLGIKLTIIDLRQEFEQHVLKYFSDSYFKGQTPNPCVMCNQEIKFGLFLREITGRNMEKMATGHYASVSYSNGCYHLHRGKDPLKDQSYFLLRLKQSQLAKVVFPLGELTKESIYQFVEQHGFHDFRGLESQDVCFLENNQVNNFLQNRQQQPDQEGSIVSTSGKKLGTHKGLYRYTIGQRRGLGISSDTPLYVIRLDTTTNTVFVGKDDELFKNELHINHVHWLSDTPPDTTQSYNVCIRYTHKGALARLVFSGDTTKIMFDQPQRAVTPGQFAAIYQDDELLGSGVIL